MPSLNRVGGGTNLERFKAQIIDKIYGGSTSPTIGHMKHSARSQTGLRQIDFDRNAPRSGSTVAGDDSSPLIS